MRRTLLAALSAAAATSSLLLVFAPSATAAPPPANPGLQHRNVPVCDQAPAGMANCHAIRHDTLDSSGRPVSSAATSLPAGFGPNDLQAAYKLPGAPAVGSPTVAIVDAYDDPNAEADLATYRAKYGLPACTSKTGCFRKVSQTGSATSLPARSAAWAQEISLDLDMVSAACPGCRILLVEAKSASFADLGTAVDYAATQDVVAISNSYGGSDTNAASVVGHYDHPGIAVTASTGDNGYGVQSPASFSTVIAVGGTSLKKASTSRGWTETAWSGAGSGCSALNLNQWQVDTDTTCTGHKANADVSAVADPNTGVAVYDSYAYQGVKGWLVFGGTSASSPIVASAYALGDPQHLSGYPAAWTWQNRAALYDVSSGSNGNCLTWCTAGAGWDGPTGLGTPNGVGAF